MTIHVSKRALLAGSARLERKDASGGSLEELNKSFAEIHKAFTEFKEKNDASITEVKKGFDDVVRREQIDKISNAISDAEKKHNELAEEILAMKRKPMAGAGGEEKTADQIEYEKRFRNWFRKGETRDFTEGDLRDLEGKALSVGSNADGGFTVLPEVDRMIDETIKLVSPFRQLATVRQIGTASYKKIVNVHGTTSGWVGETESRPETVTPVLREVEIPVNEIYAEPRATQSLLDDSFVNIEQWLADEVQLEFAQKEGVAFISGSGLKQPTGILTQTIAADTANLAWGSVGYYVTGASGAFHTNEFDPLHDIVHGLKAAYRANASWIMNRRVFAAARKLKDAQDNYLWQPSVQAGQPSTLLGYPTFDMEDMPDMAANSYSVGFGDWRRAYTIVDRIGTRVLRDPFTAKPYVKFYTTKRVGGNVTMHEAYKLLKFGTS